MKTTTRAPRLLRDTSRSYGERLATENLRHYDPANPRIFWGVITDKVLGFGLDPHADGAYETWRSGVYMGAASTLLHARFDQGDFDPSDDGSPVVLDLVSELEVAS